MHNLLKSIPIVIVEQHIIVGSLDNIDSFWHINGLWWISAEYFNTSYCIL